MNTNLFDLSDLLMPLTAEVFQTLLDKPGIRLERIISTGQTTPSGEWYDQAEAEWVVLLQGQAELTYEDGRYKTLVAGDTCWIPAHTRHRVTYTSQEPACIWLALHLKPSQ